MTRMKIENPFYGYIMCFFVNQGLVVKMQIDWLENFTHLVEVGISDDTHSSQFFSLWKLSVLTSRSDCIIEQV